MCITTVVRGLYEEIVPLWEGSTKLDAHNDTRVISWAFP